MSEQEMLSKLNVYLVIMREYNRIANAEPEEKRLSFGEFAILCHLSVKFHPVLTSELADYREVSAAVTSAAVTRLVEIGYAVRRRCSEDARKREVCLTRLGESYVSLVIPELNQSISHEVGTVFSFTSDLLSVVDKMGSEWSRG